MRTLGLIAVFAVALFFTGWLLLRRTDVVNWQEQLNPFGCFEPAFTEPLQIQAGKIGSLLTLQVISHLGNCRQLDWFDT